MRSGWRNKGFTLVELLTATGVFSLILVLTLTVTSNVSKLTNRGTQSLASFQEARTAFETLNRTLSQAVLNSYWDYDSPTSPQHYLRASELHFLLGPSDTVTNLSSTAGSAVFFQAPLSMTQQSRFRNRGDFLNAIGFYTRFSEVEDLPPFLAEQRSATRAWRLWMYLEPTENFKVYDLFSGNPQAASDPSWYQDTLSNPQYNHILANNIVLLLIRAGYTNANGDWVESYSYDSRGNSATTAFPQAEEIHQLPPILNVTMVAISSETAAILLQRSGGQPYSLIPNHLFTDAANYTDDIKELAAHLDSRPLYEAPVQYRIFETVVQISSSKWSQ